jgi:RNA polymerase sigma factor (sigma-70 family)
MNEVEYAKLLSMARSMVKLYRLNIEPHDLVHETYLVCREKAEQFDPSRGAWLQWAKVRMRKIALLAQAAECTTRPEGTDFEEACDDVTLSPEQGHDLDMSLSRMTPRTREILLLWSEGHSKAEVARRLGLSVDAVRKAIRRPR